MTPTGGITRLPPPERAFIGLDNYVETDADWFAGRDDDVEQVQALVQDCPSVLLIGYEGVGKTSLIRAGLVPRSRANGWHCVYLPLDGLIALDMARLPRHLLTGPVGQRQAEEREGAAGQAAVGAAGRAHHDLRDLLTELLGEASPAGASFESAFERVAERYSDTTVLIVFDQFERLAWSAPAVADEFFPVLADTVTGRWPNLRLLIAYRGDAEPDVGPPLQRIAGSVSGPPRCYLLPLSPSTAAHILRTGFEAAGVAFADEDLLPDFLNELQSPIVDRQAPVATGRFSRGVFPAHLQMVGHTLCQVALDNDGVLTPGLYEQLGGVPGILGDYLALQLERFEKRRREAEDVLAGLVQHGPQTERQLQDITGLKAELAEDEWSKLLADLVDARLIRLREGPLGATQVLVVHEMLAEMVQYETLRQGRELRRLRGALALRASALEKGPVVMHSGVTAELYLWRERIVPKPAELRLLLHNVLMERGPAWYWLRRVSLVGIRNFLLQAYESLSPELHRAGGLALAAAASASDAVILRDMLQDDDPMVRAAVARALTEVIPEMGPDDGLVLRYLLEVSDASVRQAAAQALARILATVGRDILPYLPEMLRDDDPDARYIAEQTLSHVADREDIPLLREMLQDQDLNVLKAAWGVLTQVLSRTPPQHLDELQVMLTDDDPYVQGAAREALTHVIGLLDPQMRPADEMLLRELSHSDDPNVRCEATLALVAALAERGPDAVSELRPLLDDWDADVRSAAGRSLANALAQLALDAPAGDSDEMAELRTMMGSSDRSTRLASTQVVAGLLARQGRAAIPELRQLLDDADPQVRQAARNALEEVLAEVGREAIPDLEVMLEDSNWDVWQAAGLALARVLSELGQPGLPALRGLLREGEDPEVRRAAGAALAGVLRGLGPVAVPELQMLLKDEEVCVQRAAGRALAQVLEDSGPQGVSDLRPLLRNEDAEIRGPARQALIGVTTHMDQEALPLLRDLLGDEHGEVRDAARAALDHVADRLGRRAMPFLREMLHDHHPCRRHAAAATITALDPVRGLQAWAELVVAYPLDDEDATRALVALDRELYCPFAETWKSRVLRGADGTT